jgi:protein-L-isoaspartate(D-aspartate) O-methyltransferase
MVIPIGGRSGQVLTVFERKGPDSYEEFYDVEVLFVPLVGAEGWSEGS